jgi:hypothetical protein
MAELNISIIIMTVMLILINNKLKKIITKNEEFYKSQLDLLEKILNK